MYPVDCERSEEHGSSAGGTPVAPAAVHGISVGVFIYVGRSSGPISCFFWGGLFFFSSIIAERENTRRCFCSTPLLCHSRAGRDFFFLCMQHNGSRGVLVSFHQCVLM